MRRNSVGWNDASADHINRMHEKMIMKKGRRLGKNHIDPASAAAVNRMAADASAALGNDVTNIVGHIVSADDSGISVEPIDAGDFYIQGAANHETARADWELSAKRSAFFLQLEHHAQSWATSDIHMPALLRSGLFRTVSDRAMLCAWGWQLPATQSVQ